MHRALRSIAAIAAVSVVGCARSASPAAPALSHVDPPEVSDGETPALWREGTPGAILLFVRNVMSRNVQDTAEDLANAFVRACEPDLDAIAIVEPGVALAWPHIRERAAEELARRQRWRAQCLAQRGVPRDLAEEDAKRQVQLIIDERNGVRHEVLGAADPGGDIVVAVFDARGDPLYRMPVKADATFTQTMRVVHDAIAAARERLRASAPEHVHTSARESPRAPLAARSAQLPRVYLSIHESTSSCQRFECAGLRTQWFSSGK
jgi:hypothetical protein